MVSGLFSSNKPDTFLEDVVDAHHIQHWSTGGETRLDNLMLLCSQHHKLVHEGGFTLQRDYQNHWFFKRPDGRAVPACGDSLKDRIDDEGDVSELLNNPPAGGLLSGMKIFVSALQCLVSRLFHAACPLRTYAGRWLPAFGTECPRQALVSVVREDPWTRAEY